MFCRCRTVSFSGLWRDWRRTIWRGDSSQLSWMKLENGKSKNSPSVAQMRFSQQKNYSRADFLGGRFCGVYLFSTFWVFRYSLPGLDGDADWWWCDSWHQLRSEWGRRRPCHIHRFFCWNLGRLLRDRHYEPEWCASWQSNKPVEGKPSLFFFSIPESWPFSCQDIPSEIFLLAMVGKYNSFLVFWWTFETPGLSVIISDKNDKTAKTWGAPIQICLLNPAFPYRFISYSVAYDNQDTFVLVVIVSVFFSWNCWSSHHKKKGDIVAGMNTGPDLDVYFVRSTDGGESWGPISYLNTNAPFDGNAVDTNPKVVFTGNIFMCVWTSTAHLRSNIGCHLFSDKFDKFSSYQIEPTPTFYSLFRWTLVSHGRTLFLWTQMLCLMMLMTTMPGCSFQLISILIILREISVAMWWRVLCRDLDPNCERYLFCHFFCFWSFFFSRRRKRYFCFWHKWLWSDLEQPGFIFLIALLLSKHHLRFDFSVLSPFQWKTTASTIFHRRCLWIKASGVWIWCQGNQNRWFLVSLCSVAEDSSMEGNDVTSSFFSPSLSISKFHLRVTTH